MCYVKMFMFPENQECRLNNNELIVGKLGVESNLGIKGYLIKGRDWRCRNEKYGVCLASDFRFTYV